MEYNSFKSRYLNILATNNSVLVVGLVFLFVSYFCVCLFKCTMCACM